MAQDQQAHSKHAPSPTHRQEQGRGCIGSKLLCWAARGGRCRVQWVHGTYEAWVKLAAARRLLQGDQMAGAAAAAAGQAACK